MKKHITLLFLLALLIVKGQDTKVNITKNVDYLEGQDYSKNKDKLDIYMPAGAKNAPVIFFLHGGGLLQGSKNQGEYIANRFVKEGYGVVSANYRLSPDVMHPAHTEDASAAYAWVIKNIKKYGGNPSKVYISGHSAGAYLAVLIALDDTYLAAHQLTPDVIAGTIAISPFLYVEETAKDRPKTVWGNNPKNWLKASVTPYTEKGKKPMLCIYADGDAGWRKNQNERFGKTMRKLGNKVQVNEVPNRNHTSLISSINNEDDQIATLVKQFINSN
ncbi:alpha/beta hydrolase fold domain-containing protein [Flavobacteriaceae bacterium R38]|nr:alpha/beta hydrolase fold domain-containing protein [Flavobacteriaceae bacterium R38]